MYDFLIAGAGLFGAVFARQAADAGKKCLVIERSEYVGGNLRCENIEGINVHKFGAHIFHTDKKEIWDYVNRYAKFNFFVNSPVANWRGELYNLPFNMNTFYQMWGVKTPEEAAAKITEQRSEITGEPQNLEQQAISLVGRDIYEKLIKGYTEKQWGRPCSELPAFIIRRLPVRYTFDNNYFNDSFQGIPEGGYNPFIANLLDGCEVRLNTDYNSDREYYNSLAEKVIYTGTLDSFFDYDMGRLEYRSLRFETETLDTDNYQGVAVMNFTDAAVPYTRIIEHKHFENSKSPRTVISREYSLPAGETSEPYYPVNDERNQELYLQYAERAVKQLNVYFGGRLAEYKYYDMDKVIESALCMSEQLLKKNV